MILQGNFDVGFGRNSENDDNIDIFITIDKLHDFLSYFGYNYSVNKYKRKNVSKKNRGKFSESTKNRISKLYSDDVFLFERTVKVPNI